MVGVFACLKPRCDAVLAALREPRGRELDNAGVWLGWFEGPKRRGWGRNETAIPRSSGEKERVQKHRLMCVCVAFKQTTSCLVNPLFKKARAAESKSRHLGVINTTASQPGVSHLETISERPQDPKNANFQNLRIRIQLGVGFGQL